ncbi:TylF/MycF/NovP-related O-methyltransferase [uncultured Thalassospira sp.]|jgi:hypothetical protein|uniref:TylF/MycF/NovP-related O-methyltransferase n=1 Tax=uncultured Thalassospira sp. TaxID=404382 RepID=UPI0032B2E6AC|tara:strand:- start:1800 stop:2516 length:717 start_codon:yes stop_codon:yes gene_type:complete
MKAKVWEFGEKFVRNFAPELRSEPKLLRYLLQKRAIQASADYVYDNMKHAQFFEIREELYRYVFDQCEIEGLVLELGVHNGNSINYIAKLTGGRVHGFDSFEGLPHDGKIPDFKSKGSKWYKGKMNEDGRLPSVRENVVLHKGWFDQTLPDFFESNKECISVMHIDCDIYSSTKTSLECAKDRLSVGSYIIFDEYLNYFGWEANEFLAWQEFVEANAVTYQYVGVANTGAVAIKVTKI